jgi:hypothetical protein
MDTYMVTMQVGVYCLHIAVAVTIGVLIGWAAF